MKQLTLWLLIGILTLSGCEGGTQTNVQSRCGGADGPNVCMVTLVSIEGGVYRHDIKNSSFWQGTTAIEVTVRITVEKGTLRVWLEDPQRNKTLVGVEPGQAAELKGVASVTDTGGTRSFSVYFEPLGEAKRAENVQAEIRYDTHHTISKSLRNSTTQVSSAVGSSERVEHVKMGPRSLATGAVTKIGERRHDDGGGPSATAAVREILRVSAASPLLALRLDDQSAAVTLLGRSRAAAEQKIQRRLS